MHLPPMTHLGQKLHCKSRASIRSVICLDVSPTAAILEISFSFDLSLGLLPGQQEHAIVENTAGVVSLKANDAEVLFRVLVLYIL